MEPNGPSVVQIQTECVRNREAEEGKEEGWFYGSSTLEVLGQLREQFNTDPSLATSLVNCQDRNLRD